VKRPGILCLQHMSPSKAEQSGISSVPANRFRVLWVTPTSALMNPFAGRGRRATQGHAMRWPPFDHYEPGEEHAVRHPPSPSALQQMKRDGKKSVGVVAWDYRSR